MEHHHPLPSTPDPTVGVHGMLLVGEGPVYLSHLPMFMAPHNFQVVLQVALDADASRQMQDSRARLGSHSLYTVKPEEFPIVDLVSDDPAEPARVAFVADVVEGHFERGGDVIARSATIHVDDVIHFSELEHRDRSPELEYILFGTAAQFFLVHRVTGPPDFDQVLAVNVTGHPFTEDELHRERSGVLVTVPERPNAAAERMRPGERLACQGHVVGAHRFLDLQVEVLAEIYFEQGELLENPTFDPTDEETTAGFGEQ